ncbi:toll-like receptor 13 [Hyposmocoma kahamanoa]|uniref:toll-like receptor 13 n=1 Tax=Hyposmocoma kahamanoa TaxID=1477025 RepID=UPI000E6D8707|nr:toll-like receptor 13 [Hyposmocoma kahamanoa]
MVKYIILTTLCITVVARQPTNHNIIRHDRSCLTGYMTDVQSWVDENGEITDKIDFNYILDLSWNPNPTEILTQNVDRILQPINVKYLSMAKSNLLRVPAIFHFQGRSGQPISSTVEYLTLYGNNFLNFNAPGAHYGVRMNATDAKEADFNLSFRLSARSAWAAGFQSRTFSKLKELDLRRCSIEVINDNTFEGMPELQALYLGENNINIISANAFNGLRSLLHLDVSHNHVGFDNEKLLLEGQVFKPVAKLTSLDLSYTKINNGDLNFMNYFRKSLERLSLCFTQIPRLKPFSLNGTSLRLLDLSGNPGILQGKNLLKGLEGYLEVLYADDIGLKSAEDFYTFDQLEILRLRNNELTAITGNVVSSLKNLQVLDLSNNRLSSWFWPVFSLIPQLNFLSLQNNNFNIITPEMLKDIGSITYVGFAGNFVVCNCNARELFELAYQNENVTSEKLLKSLRYPGSASRIDLMYHRGFDDYNEMILSRSKVTKPCYNTECKDVEDLETEGKFLLVDFQPSEYQCFFVAEGKPVPFSSVATCRLTQINDDIDEIINKGWNKLLLLLIIPTVMLPLFILGYVFRKNFIYFCITMRNSATLSLINNDAVPEDGTFFNYDVFVSYCNDDRDWVLDYLLPHVEKDCNVCVCLHERDFQVGLSILENIVSCMDRSRSIMLIISQQFLASQWCQFEMHLAQHRLLETRREDLILVLLEEIPRPLRPTTLHYLMLTKTYIVWPKNASEQAVFWRRLKKSLVMHKIMTTQNIS